MIEMSEDQIVQVQKNNKIVNFLLIYNHLYSNKYRVIHTVPKCVSQ